MKSDSSLILAVLFLGAGLTIIFTYGVGTGAFNAAYPMSAASLQMSITTNGPAAIGGLALTAIGLLFMFWALLCAIVGQFMVFGTEGGRTARLERMEQKRLDQQERLEQRRLAREERLLERQERLKVR
jgi:hypothetical protein